MESAKTAAHPERSDVMHQARLSIQRTPGTKAKRLPFNGNKQAEDAFIASLYVCRSATVPKERSPYPHDPYMLWSKARQAQMFGE